MLFSNSLVPGTGLDLAPFQKMLLRTSYLRHSLCWQGPQRSVIVRADVENICCTSLEMTMNKELVLCIQHSLDNLRALGVSTLLVYDALGSRFRLRTTVCFSSSVFLSSHLVTQHWACTGLSYRANTEELCITIHRGRKEVTATTNFASIIFLPKGLAFPKATMLDGSSLSLGLREQLITSPFWG